MWSPWWNNEQCLLPTPRSVRPTCHYLIAPLLPLTEMLSSLCRMYQVKVVLIFGIQHFGHSFHIGLVPLCPLWRYFPGVLRSVQCNRDKIGGCKETFMAQSITCLLNLFFFLFAKYFSIFLFSPSKLGWQLSFEAVVRKMVWRSNKVLSPKWPVPKLSTIQG